MATTSAPSKITDLVATQWPYVLSTLLAFAAAWLLQAALKRDPLSSLPMVGIEFGNADKRRAAFVQGAKNIYLEGYRKFRKGVFRITTSSFHDVVVLDPSFLSELKNLPDDTVSFGEAVSDFMQSKYTGIRADRPIIPHIVKKDLIPALNRLNPVIAEEVDQSYREELPPCKDFTPVNIYSKLLRIVAKVSGRIFIGPELCRSEKYIDTAIKYTIEVVGAVQAITEMGFWHRTLNAGAHPAVKTVRAREKAADAFLRPIVEGRKKAQKVDPDFQKPDDLLQWLLDDGQDKFGEKGSKELASIQLGLTFAAIHTTSMTATNAFYTLAAMPEIMPELREEIRAVLKEHGTFTTQALQKMKKLDSFLREVMRMHPLGFSSFQRKVLKTFTLSNGQVIPAGCLIEVPIIGINFDDEVVDDPEKFDAFRSYRAREMEGLAGTEKANAGATNQFVTVSPTNLLFGYGRHACPGRFFAANEIKMIVSRAVLDYDMEMANGSTERYPNLTFGGQSTPDPSREILFKRVAI
ncbi:ent-kaurene oxidase [Diaporthe amygdali]|uniref:ent-kaurene oxidase n=1 Tax=Phomopsis amygdali TaxID=1214568 RepID=UPI0022FEE8CB|nr:ent-kaurene oxidase [Diaporthe amygdali]KAJ0122972.1 ent-kaurene oxidase [Diaporthe amygdali]